MGVKATIDVGAKDRAGLPQKLDTSPNPLDPKSIRQEGTLSISSVEQ